MAKNVWINKMVVKWMDRIKELRDVMRKHNIDIYYIPTDDYHSSEFVGNYFKVR